MPLSGISPAIRVAAPGGSLLSSQLGFADTLPILSGQTLGPTGLWTTVVYDRLGAYDGDGGYLTPSAGLYQASIYLTGNQETGSPASGGVFYSLLLNGSAVGGNAQGHEMMSGIPQIFAVTAFWDVLDAGTSIQCSVTNTLPVTYDLSTAGYIQATGAILGARFCLTYWGPQP
jgi:hypothetical protein